MTMVQEDRSMTILSPVLMDSGESVLTLPLHVALCRALHDLAEDVPFAIRPMGGGPPWLVCDSTRLDGAESGLVRLLVGLSAPEGITADDLNPVTRWPSHPLDPVGVALRPETSGELRVSPPTSLFVAINAAAERIAEGGTAGGLLVPSPEVDEPLLRWHGRSVLEDSGIAALVRACVADLAG